MRRSRCAEHLLLGLLIAHVPARADVPTSAAKPAAPTPTQAPGIEIIALSAQPIVYRTVKAKPAELEAKLREAFLGLVGTAATRGLEIAGPPLARYQVRATTADGTFVVEAALPLRKRPTKPLGDAGALGALPAGPAAVLVHRGRLDQLPQAHAALDAWLVANKRTAAGPRWEVYVTNPMTEPDPDKQQVTVVAPVER